MVDIKREKVDNVTYVKLREFGLEKTLSFARPISSAMFHEVIYPGGLDVTGRILVDRQSFEMCLSASDLCRFVVPQIIREQAALSFDDEIKAFLAIRSEEQTSELPS